MVWHSYTPKSRYSTIIGGEASRAKFHCLYNSGAGLEDTADILIFGSSRTGSSINDKLVSRLATDYSGESVLVKNMNIAGGDISMSYMFLKEIIESNSAPDMVYVEILRVKRQVSLIPYLNRAFSSSADWSLTADLLRNYDDGRTGLFRLADFFQVIIDKNDKYISKLLVRKNAIVVDHPNACKFLDRAKVDEFLNNPSLQNATNRYGRFEKAKRREFQALAKQRREAAKIRRIDNIKRRERAIKRHNQALGKNWESLPPENWGYDSPESQRQLYYYQAISKLCRENNIDLIFFRPYGLREPEHDPNMIGKYEDLFEGEILSLPYRTAKLTFPYYVDPNHSGKQTERIIAFWLTEDILARRSK